MSSNPEEIIGLPEGKMYSPSLSSHLCPFFLFHGTQCKWKDLVLQTLLAYACRLDGVVGVGTLASCGEEGA
jgi:hypothetical protein